MAGSNFTLQWPVESGKISTPYDAATGILKLTAVAGTVVSAGAAGRIVAASGNTVQITSGNFTVAYSNLRNLSVAIGQDVTSGTKIGESAGPDILVSIFQAIDPTPTLAAAPVPTPVTPEPAPTPGKPANKLYLVPTLNNLRVREKPVSGNPIGMVSTDDILEVLEPIDAARPKVGVDGEWINIKNQYGLTGFSAAQYLKEYPGPFPIPAPLPALTGVTGMNLDMYNPLGHPNPDRLKGIGWIRVKFNVSYNPDNNTYGNTDVNAAFNRVRPFIQPYAKAGIKVLMVFTHQLFGEGAGYHWPSMDSGRWNEFIPKYADYAKRTAALFAGLGLVSCYQIWNEQDTPPAVARAAVPIPAKDYANMLAQTIRAIRSVDSKTLLSRAATSAGLMQGLPMLGPRLPPCPGMCGPTASPRTLMDVAFRVTNSAHLVR
ncbi:MAG: M23 family metallopeptidase [Anaerolineae bacterium]